MRKVCLVLFLSFLALACKKEHEKLWSYPIELHCTSYRNTSSVRLYTHQGEITDQAIVNNFIAYHKLQALTNKPTILSLNKTDTIRFISKDSVLIKQGHSFRRYSICTPGYNFIVLQPTQGGNVGYDADELKKFFARRSGNFIEFIPKDTGYVFQEKASFPFFKYKPSYLQLHPIPASTGYSSFHRIVFNKYAFGNEDQLEFPLMNYYIISHRNWSVSSNISVDINNLLNTETATTKLESGDTLAVQEYKVIFKRTSQ